jgi:hypothetical protein
MPLSEVVKSRFHLQHDGALLIDEHRALEGGGRERSTV